MRMFALTKRILLQTIHDIRTLLLILFAPIVVLTMIYFILNAQNNNYSIGIINEQEDSEASTAIIEDEDVNSKNKEFEDQIKENEDFTVTISYVNIDEAIQQIRDQKLDAAVELDTQGNANLYINGTDVSVASTVEHIIMNTNATIHQNSLKQQLEKASIPGLSITEPDYKIEYVTGNSDGDLFDKFGTQLIGIIVFFFVFLIAGINFLNERTSGTMEKLLSTPMRRYEIVCGYMLGFGIMAILQSTLITIFAVYALGLHVQGNILLVLLVNLLTAVNALCLGILLSTIANSEFQMVQFIPVVILPQIFLAGLFRLSGIWEKVGYLAPLHYTSDALTNVMVIGNGISSIKYDLLVLTLLSAFFIWVNILLLKRQRAL